MIEMEQAKGAHEVNGPMGRTRGPLFGVAIALAIGLTVLLSILGVAGQGLGAATMQSKPLSGGTGTVAATSAPALSTQTYTPLSLSIGAVPHSICVDDSPLCSAQVGESQVTLTAAAPNVGLATWPSVQVAFVIETTVYDGVYDPSAGDSGPRRLRGARRDGVRGVERRAVLRRPRPADRERDLGREPPLERAASPSSTTSPPSMATTTGTGRSTTSTSRSS